MENIVIIPEIKNCLISLSSKEKEELKESILTNGCRDALVLWGDVLVDGHNRYEICSQYEIPYETVQMNFENMEEAKNWIYKNQLARRNLNDAEKISLAKKITETKSKIAKSIRLNNLKQNTENANVTHSENINDIEKMNVNKEVADIAEVSERTVARFNTIQNKAPENVKQAVKDNVISINRGYEITKEIEKLPKEQKTDEIVNQYIKGEFKKIEEDAAIQKNIHNAVYKILTTEITEEYLEIWFKGLDNSTKENLNDDLDRAIAEYQKIKEFYKKQNIIRRIK